MHTAKLLSDDPSQHQDAAVRGIRRLLGLPESTPIPPGLVHSVRMGTTVATNALLERKGAPTLLLTDDGFADLLLIGDQSRPDLFDLSAARPAPLYAQAAAITGRIDAGGAELAPLDDAATLVLLHAARAAGLQAVAIALMHAWRFPHIEQRVAALARAAGFPQISASHEVSPLLRLIPRAEITAVDAYLTPVLRQHVRRLEAALPAISLLFMQSHGGLAAADIFRGKDAILSGPAGGIVGAARTAMAAGFPRVIGLDMGGTSTDVALYDGAFQRTHATEIAGIRLHIPMLAIHTIAAGGGSILRFDGTRLRVGPESAGATPGPAAYRQGGELTITDANICVGRIQPAYFPALFGPNADQELDAATVHARFTALAAEIAAATHQPQHPQTVADGFLRVAVASMAAAIKHVCRRSGRDPRDFALNCFGGAGGQLACRVADELAIATVLVHPLAGVLSAYGMGLADQTVLLEQAIEQSLDHATIARMHIIAAELAAKAIAALRPQTTSALPPCVTTHAALRLDGTDAPLAIPLTDLPTLRAAFIEAYTAQLGFAPADRPLIADSVTVEVTLPGAPLATPSPCPGTVAPTPIDTVTLWSDAASHPAKVFDRAALRPRDRVAGPAVLREPTATTIIDPGWHAEVAPDGMLILRRATPAARPVPSIAAADPALLELFHALFIGAARQAGAILQRTAQSVNIRERLDFSCAVFDAAGALVANAPHVPVHLGAMGESVRHILRRRGTSLTAGDVFALNNPYAGGTHLPDITVITPIFADGALHAFAASRAHHADIGGAIPGSTPPHSRTLAEEGVVIDDFAIVRDGIFQEPALRALLAGAPYPARNPDMNVADLAAQIAANATAAAELRRIAAQYGWPTLQAYMRHVMDNGEASVRRLIATLRDGAFTYPMDDGAILQVALRTDRTTHRLSVDFSGTSRQHPGNFNAPPAVTRAVILYVLRCLVADDIPLNDGCLRPVDLHIPPGSFLSPAEGAAVVAGNTEVSQAVCNALLGALGAAASSQATMNNLLFGDADLQYYETICGGAGAGPGWHGADAVQTHMTNTRMTDPEVLEMRAPIRVEDFSIRHDSGGAGTHRGGNGVTRRLRFLRSLTIALVASRRTIPPFGLDGGDPGAPGRQWLDHADGSRTDLPGCASARVQPGDVLTIQTPGGGGWGTSDPLRIERLSRRAAASRKREPSNSNVTWSVSNTGDFKAS